MVCTGVSALASGNLGRSRWPLVAFVSGLGNPIVVACLVFSVFCWLVCVCTGRLGSTLFTQTTGAWAGTSSRYVADALVGVGHNTIKVVI